MNPYQADVCAFMAAMGQPTPATPTLEDYPVGLRIRLILEEALEFAEAAGAPVTLMQIDPTSEPDWPEMIDALVDLLYVTFGAAVAMGVDLDPFWRIVHASNMAKLGPDGKPIRRTDGKVQKPAGWQPPDIAGMLALLQESHATTLDLPPADAPPPPPCLRPHQRDQVAEVVADYIARTPVKPIEVIGAGTPSRSLLDVPGACPICHQVGCRHPRQARGEARTRLLEDSYERERQDLALRLEIAADLHQKADVELQASKARIAELEADLQECRMSLDCYVDKLGRPNW